MEKYDNRKIYKKFQNGGDGDVSPSSTSQILDKLNKINRYDEDKKSEINMNINNKNQFTNIISVNNIDFESSDENNIEKEIKMENIKKYTSINEIPEFLETVKNHYSNLRLNLDRSEISRLITKTLNVALLGDLTKESDIFNLFMGSYEEVKKKVKIIIQKIREFNRSCKFEYWIDLDKIVYLLWFKEIKFVRNLIIDISQNLEYQLNIVHINSYLIDRLYNDPKYTKYYIKILIMLIETDNGSFLSNDKLRNFFTSDKIYKIYDIIRLILFNDNSFLEFLDKCKKIKLDKEKENNDISKVENFNNIEEIETDFRKDKKILLTSSEKRTLNIETLFKENQKDDNDNDIPSIKNIIVGLDEDLWNAFNLFIYKKFNFDITRYIEQTNKLTDGVLSKIRLDYFSDLEVPFTVRIHPGEDGSRGTILLGGQNNYLEKYLKYKEKYMKIKYLNNKS